MAHGYLELCESLWRSWLTGDLDVPPELKAFFDLEAAPEPYLALGTGPRPLVVLTTNPGGTMPHQHRSAILAGLGPVNAAMSYAQAARRFGAFYREHLKGPAGARIHAMDHLAELMSADGVLQVEVCPFHSPLLPRKTRWLDLAARGGLLADYIAHTREFIRKQPTIAVSAVSSKVTLYRGLPFSPWLNWQAEMLGVDTKSARCVPLVRKGSKITGAALVDYVNGSAKALVIMMGSNRLPGERGRRILTEAMLNDARRV